MKKENIGIGDLVKVLRHPNPGISSHISGQIARVITIETVDEHKKPYIIGVGFEGDKRLQGVYCKDVEKIYPFPASSSSLINEVTTTVQMKRKPKDGDDVNCHKGHKIVNVDAIKPGDKSYLYCRDCKIEVVDKKDDNIEWVPITNKLPSSIRDCFDNTHGNDLDRLALRYGIKRVSIYAGYSFPETDESLRDRMKHYVSLYFHN